MYIIINDIADVTPIISQNNFKMIDNRNYNDNRILLSRMLSLLLSGLLY